MGCEKVENALYSKNRTETRLILSITLDTAPGFLELLTTEDGAVRIPPQVSKLKSYLPLAVGRAACRPRRAFLEEPPGRDGCVSACAIAECVAGTTPLQRSAGIPSANMSPAHESPLSHRGGPGEPKRKRGRGA